MKRIALALVLALAAPSNARVVVGPDTITIPSGRVVFAYSLTSARAIRVRNAFALVYGYQALLTCNAAAVVAGNCSEGDPPFPNPVTQRQFVDTQIGRYFVAVVRNAESRSAAAAAQAAEDAKPDVVVE